MKTTLLLPLLLFTLSGGCISESRYNTKRGVSAPRQVLVPLWEKSLFTYKRFSPIPEQFGAPVFNAKGNTLFLATSKGEVVRIGLDGRGIWRTQLKGSFQTAPALFEEIDLLVVGTVGGTLYGLNPATGKQRWSFQGFGSFMGGFSYKNGVVYGTTAKNMLYAITADTGELHWSRRNETINGFTVRGHSSPVLHGNTLYMGLSDGRYQALDITKRGTLIWSKTLENPEEENYIDADADPVVEGETLFVATYRKGVAALERATGDLLWKYPAYGVTAIKIFHNRLYFVSPSDGIHCLGKDGRLIWRQNVEYGTPKSMILKGRRMVVAFDQGGLLALDPETGYFFQRFDTGGGISGNPALHGRHLATLANNGKLYLFQLR